MASTGFGPPQVSRPIQALFIYGTLHPDRAPEEIRHAVAHLKHIGPATVTGQHLQLDGYPGLITNGEQNTIPGDLFALPDDPTLYEATWQAFDTYEGVAEGLFRRERILVTLSTGEQQAHWTYLYNGPLPTEPARQPFSEG